LDSDTPTAGQRRDRFVTTRWSVILSCADLEGGEQKTRKALAELCKIYWRPVFAFIYHQGQSIPDAQDLTQDFFVTVLKGQLLQRADRNRGRFRSLMLRALQDFLRDAADKRRTRKRGGDVQFVSWDEWMAEAPSRFSLPTKESESWSPERIFDVRWAATVVERFVVTRISVQTLIQQTGQTETAPDPRCRSTFWTRDRFLPEPHRSRRTVHGQMLKKLQRLESYKRKTGGIWIMNHESQIVSHES
jgi:DNA-directed RNA polymerase specialized sigma24 family protein